MLTIAYHGIPGTYSQKAAQMFFRNEARLDCRGLETFDDVFAALEKKQVTYSCIPLENSLVGSIHTNYHLLERFSGFIVGEIYLRISHALLAIAGTKLSDIKTIISHPQALAQCAEFFEENPDIKSEAGFDTARSAKLVFEKQDRTLAAIGNPLAGELYNLTILKKGIESNKENYTRFIILGSKKEEADANKVSLLYSVKHTPGSLWRSLAPFGQRNLNLTKIESIPVVGTPWEYCFFVDIEAPPNSEAKKALEEFKKETIWIKNLGWYQKGRIYEE